MTSRAPAALAALALTASLGASLAACRHAAPASPAGGASDRRAFIATIRLCETTEAALRAALGAPTRDGRLADARVVSWIISDDDVTAYLAVLLDARAVVLDLYWDIPTEIPWTPTSHCPPAP